MDTQNDLLAVRVQLYDKKEYIVIEKEKVGDWEVFIRKALVKFGIDPDCMANVLLWDNNGTAITKDIFKILMMQYINCNSFSIKMCVKSDINEPLVVQDLKYFLLENGCRGIFLEAESIGKQSSANAVEIGDGDEANIVDNTNATGGKNTLSEESVQFLSERLMDFINLKYSINKWDDVEEICKAAVIIFPSIELSRLFNFKKRCGIIYQKIIYLKYRKTSTKTKIRAVEQGTTTDENDNTVSNNQSDDETDELSYLLYFKTCLVDRDLAILKIKLEQTIEMRQKLLNKKGVNIHKTFPFYFLEPNLILYDYAIRNKSRDPNIFFDVWSKNKAEVLVTVKPTERDELLKLFNDDIGYFLALLKLLAPRNSNLELLVPKFIVYSNNINDDPHNSIDSSNKYPYLIAIGPTKADIKCFYIPIDKQLILVPTEFKSFDKVFDMFFKLHFVFNVDYNPGLKIFLTFIEHYVYEIHESPVTATVSKVARNIFKD